MNMHTVRTTQFRLLPLVVIVCLTALSGGCRQEAQPPSQTLSQEDFLSLLHSNRIAHGVITYDPQSPYLQTIEGTYYQGAKVDNPSASANRQRQGTPFTAKVRLTDTLEDQVLNSGRFETRQAKFSAWPSLFYGLGPLALLLLLVVLVLAFLVLGIVWFIVRWSTVFRNLQRSVDQTTADLAEVKKLIKEK